MDTKQDKRITKYFLGLINLFLLCSCSPIPADSQPRPWQVVGSYDEHQSIMTVGFLDETHVVTGGVVGQMAYSSDGAETGCKPIVRQTVVMGSKS